MLCSIECIYIVFSIFIITSNYDLLVQWSICLRACLYYKCRVTCFQG